MPENKDIYNEERTKKIVSENKVTSKNKLETTDTVFLLNQIDKTLKSIKKSFDEKIKKTTSPTQADFQKQFSKSLQLLNKTFSALPDALKDLSDKLKENTSKIEESNKKLYKALKKSKDLPPYLDDWFKDENKKELPPSLQKMLYKGLTVLEEIGITIPRIAFLAGVARFTEMQKDVALLTFQMENLLSTGKDTVKTFDDLTKRLFKVGLETGLNAKNLYEVAKNLTLIRVKWDETIKVGGVGTQLLTQFIEKYRTITQVSLDSITSLIKTTRVLIGDQQKQIAQTTANILDFSTKVQSAFGMTSQDMEASIKGLQRILSQTSYAFMKFEKTGQIFFDTKKYENLSKGVLTLAGSLSKFGIDAEKVVNMLSDLLDPDKFEENLTAYAMMGVNIADYMAGNFDKVMNQISQGLPQTAMRLAQMAGGNMIILGQLINNLGLQKFFGDKEVFNALLRYSQEITRTGKGDINKLMQAVEKQKATQERWEAYRKTLERVLEELRNLFQDFAPLIIPFISVLRTILKTITPILKTVLNILTKEPFLSFIKGIATVWLSKQLFGLLKLGVWQIKIFGGKISQFFKIWEILAYSIRSGETTFSGKKISVFGSYVRALGRLLISGFKNWFGIGKSATTTGGTMGGLLMEQLTGGDVCPFPPSCVQNQAQTIVDTFSNKILSNKFSVWLHNVINKSQFLSKIASGVSKIGFKIGRIIPFVSKISTNLATLISRLPIGGQLGLAVLGGYLTYLGVKGAVKDVKDFINRKKIAQQIERETGAKLTESEAYLSGVSKSMRNRMIMSALLTQSQGGSKYEEERAKLVAKAAWQKAGMGALKGGLVAGGATLAGASLGALLGSAAIASAIPVVGWIAGGAIALGAAGLALYSWIKYKSERKKQLEEEKKQREKEIELSRQIYAEHYSTQAKTLQFAFETMNKKTLFQIEKENKGNLDQINSWVKSQKDLQGKTFNSISELMKDQQTLQELQIRGDVKTKQALEKILDSTNKHLNVSKDIRDNTAASAIHTALLRDALTQKPTTNIREILSLQKKIQGGNIEKAEVTFYLPT